MKATPSFIIAAALCATLAGWNPPAMAALNIGDKAPDFTTQAALAGNTTEFSLAQALKKGAVVLYFFPKAFTQGCTIEAHDFAEATEKFQTLGASVIGISNDDIDTLKKFSVEACRNQFSVGSDSGARIIKQYDAAMLLKPDMANRISYVISPQGKVLHVYDSLSAEHHVDNALKAVQKWRNEAKK